MRIIISPAKKMVANLESLPIKQLPVFLEKTEQIFTYLRDLSFDEAMKLWKCNEEIANLNYQRLKELDLRKQLTPAILSYQGIQYQYMAPEVLENQHLEYLQNHLRILSGFYGILRPFDGIIPYRLEMQAKSKLNETKDLYDFWGESIYQNLTEDAKVILNLASKEYSKCIEKYLGDGVRFVTCIFGEEINGKIVEKGTYAKMARGEMVRYLAEHNITDLEMVKQFDRLNYTFHVDASNDTTFVFIRQT